MRRRRAYCKLSDYPAVILPSLLSSHCHSHGYVRGSRSAMYGSPHRQIYSTRRTSRVPQHLPRRHGCHKINSFCVRTPRDGPYFLSHYYPVCSDRQDGIWTICRTCCKCILWLFRSDCLLRPLDTHTQAISQSVQVWGMQGVSGVPLSAHSSYARHQPCVPHHRATVFVRGHSRRVADHSFSLQKIFFWHGPNSPAG